MQEDDRELHGKDVASVRDHPSPPSSGRTLSIDEATRQEYF